MRESPLSPSTRALLRLLFDTIASLLLPRLRTSDKETHTHKRKPSHKRPPNKANKIFNFPAHRIIIHAHIRRYAQNDNSTRCAHTCVWRARCEIRTYTQAVYTKGSKEVTAFPHKYRPCHVISYLQNIYGRSSRVCVYLYMLECA